jgi:DNA polymerase-3 subunit delta'
MLIGQQATWQRLLADLTANRVPHALMLTGPAGAGKLALAVEFAKALLCQQPNADGTPCGTCPSCKMAAKLEHPDLHFTFPIVKGTRIKTAEGALSDVYIKEWRARVLASPYFDLNDWLEDMGAANQQATYYVAESDNIQRKLALKSSMGGRKVMVVWLPEKMNQETANKLLKLFEEPPVGTHFLLVSQEPDLVLGTIQSRVQRINVPALPEKVISQALQRQYAMPKEDANLLAHIAQGSYTEALKRMQRDSEQKLFFDLFVQLMRHSYARRVKEMHQWSLAVADLGRERQKRMLKYFQQQLRENYIYNFHQPQINFLGREEENFSIRFAPFINERNVVGIMTELSDAERDISQNVNARMVFFDLALKMIILLKTP